MAHLHMEVMSTYSISSSSSYASTSSMYYTTDERSCSEAAWRTKLAAAHQVSASHYARIMHIMDTAVNGIVQLVHAICSRLVYQGIVSKAECNAKVAHVKQEAAEAKYTAAAAHGVLLYFCTLMLIFVLLLKMEQEHKVEEAKLATERMSESLRTLNGIFRNMQGDGDALAASDLRDKVRRLEYIDSVHTTTIAGHTTYASVSATTANATMLLMQQHSAITLLLLCHRSCLYTLLQTACNAPCKHAAVAERDTEIKALKSLREHSVAVQVEAMVSKRAMEEA
eukprot:4828-Heterococcus_DN1.PRE.1